MTIEAEQPPNVSVEEALTHLEERFVAEPELLSSANGSMTVRMDVSHMCSGGCADVVQAFILHGWTLQDLDMTSQTFTVRGKATKTPYLDER